MNRKLLLILCFLSICQFFYAIEIKTVEPAFWWAGMKNPEVQIMLYGKDISKCDVTLSSKNVILKETVKLESPNYLVLYLDFTKATPEKFDIILNQGKQKKVVPFEVKERKDGSAERIGFNCEDVVYLLMPDRFANGDPSNDNISMKQSYKVDRQDMTAYHGGDLAGIENKLDYFSDLGITTLWFTPVLENDMGDGSYHGYATTDYYKIDARLGTNEDYKRLVDKAHAKGMKIIKDLIFNHCGIHHPWLLDPPTKDWINNPDTYIQTNHKKEFLFDPYVSQYDKDKMVDGWFVPSMPDLNQRNRHLAKYLIQNSIWWIEYAGVDGIRQDTYPYPDKDMMNVWCKEINNEYPNFNIVGEIMLLNSAGTGFWQKGSPLNNDESNLKSVMDFKLVNTASEVFRGENKLDILHEHLCYDFMFGDISHVLRFYENHDVARFFKEDATESDLAAFKQAYTFLLTIPGIPQLYHGGEFMMVGDVKKDYAYVRHDIPGGWNEDKINYFDRSGLPQFRKEAWSFLQKILQWRKGNDVITKGSMKHFMINNGVYVYERKYEGKSFIIFLNGKNNDVNISLTPYQEILTKSKGVDIFSKKTIELKDNLNISAKGILIIEL